MQLWKQTLHVAWADATRQLGRSGTERQPFLREEFLVLRVVGRQYGQGDGRLGQSEQEVAQGGGASSCFHLEGESLQAESALLAEREVAKVDGERVGLPQHETCREAQVLDVQVFGVELAGGEGFVKPVEAYFAASHHKCPQPQVERLRRCVLRREGIHEELHIEGCVAVLVEPDPCADELSAGDAHFLLHEGCEVHFCGNTRGLEHQRVALVVEHDVVENDASHHAYPQPSDAHAARCLLGQKLRHGICPPALEGGKRRQQEQCQIDDSHQANKDAEYVLQDSDKRTVFMCCACKGTKKNAK